MFGKISNAVAWQREFMGEMDEINLFTRNSFQLLLKFNRKNSFEDSCLADRDFDCTHFVVCHQCNRSQSGTPPHSKTSDSTFSACGFNRAGKSICLLGHCFWFIKFPVEKTIYRFIEMSSFDSSSRLTSLETTKIESFASTTTSVDKLPEEVLQQIVGHLSIQDRLKCRQVCRQWRRLSLSHITELQVGEIFCVYQNLRPPKYRIDFGDEQIQLDVLRTILQESGRSLRFLAL